MNNDKTVICLLTMKDGFDAIGVFKVAHENNLDGMDIEVFKKEAKEDAIQNAWMIKQDMIQIERYLEFRDKASVELDKRIEYQRGKDDGRREVSGGGNV